MREGPEQRGKDVRKKVTRVAWEGEGCLSAGHQLRARAGYLAGPGRPQKRGASAMYTAFYSLVIRHSLK